MKISMYQASVPVFVRALNNLAAILEKAAAHAEARKVDPAALINYRLYPDMLPFAKQVQIASDSAKGGVARLAGVEPPKYEDNEASFPEFIARLRKTVAYLESIKPEQIDGSEDKTVTWKTQTTTRTMQGMPYLLSHVTPNVYFHVTTAYDILRHCGLEIGKQDFLGKT
ncbi:MAG: DUF1993 domain-containing protein [Betaproteobacteria bacterium]|nr:DUF1993 domain-containing protein [Betaproteobacteria bacterium]